MSIKLWERWLLLVCLLVCIPSFAVEPCPTVNVTPVVPGANMFNAQQEVDLGDAIAASMLQSSEVYQDAAISEPLQRIANRLAEQLPPEHRIAARVLVFDSPSADAFSIPGRIYISRKLIAMTRNEDEMAGVLAHEMGHLVAHHSAIELSQQLRVVLKINEVGTDKDINEEWNQYLNNYRRRHVSSADVSKAIKLENREQIQADTIALYLVSRSGYSPQAFADFFDRIAATNGNTGGFWSSLFGNTTPDSKRLREMVKNRPSMAATCIVETKPAIADYAAWRGTVMDYKMVHKESLPGLVSKQRLAERLRPDIEHLRISPDGNYMLAQDETNIFVLTRSPLKPVFQIEAIGASGAQFSPDSRSVVFQIAPFDSSPRVERWDIATQKRSAAYEIYVRGGCLSTALSPDGSVLGCLTFSDEGHRFDYDLFDTASGNSFWHRKGWFDLERLATFENMGALYEILAAIQSGGNSGVFAQIGRARFSPDGRYFLAHNPYATVAMDLNTRSEIPVSNSLKDMLDGNFIFVSPDRVFGYSTFEKKCVELTFPSGGTLVKDLPIGNLGFERAASANVVVLHTRDGSQLGIYDLQQKKLLVNSKRKALDVWGDRFFTEGVAGDIVAFDLANGKQVEATELPDAPLGVLTTAGASPDLNWLVASQKSRGALWNLQTGKRVYHVRGFDGDYFVANSGVYTVFPKFQQTERTVALLGFDTNITSKRTIPEKENSFQVGRYMFVFRYDEKKLSRGYLLEVRDLLTNDLLWQKDFSKERPAYTIDPANNTLVLHWLSFGSGLHSMAKQDPLVAAKLAKFGEKDGVDYLEVLELNTGKSVGGLAFDTGKRSINVESMSAAGDNVVIGDTHSRLLVYSIDGTQRTVLSGTNPAIAPKAKRMIVRPEKNKVAVYDLSSLQVLQTYEFPARVVFTGFSEDGERLLVLTADQTVYTFELRGSAPQTKVADAAPTNAAPATK